MTRHPGISIFTGAPVRPQPECGPFYWRRTHPTVGALGRKNVTPPPAFGGLIPLIPQSSRQTNGLGFTRLGDLTRITRLTRTFLKDKTGT